MGKVINYVVFLGVILLLYHMAGLIADSPNALLLKFMLDPTTWSTASLVAKIKSAMAGAARAGITIGAILAFKDPTVLKASVSVFLLTVGWDIFAVYNQLAIATATTGETAWFALLLTAPLVLAYVLSVFQFWTGGVE